MGEYFYSRIPIFELFGLFLVEDCWRGSCNKGCVLFSSRSLYELGWQYPHHLKQPLPISFSLLWHLKTVVDSVGFNSASWIGRNKLLFDF